MFYNPLQLSDEQKLVYVRLLIFLAKADKDFSKVEEKHIGRLMRRLKLSPEVLKGLYVPKTLDEVYEVIKPINDRRAALDLVHCLWFVALADETIDNEEVEVIRKVAKALNIDDDTLLALNDFVLDEIMFLERARKTLEADTVFAEYFPLV